ncbi:MAG: alpha/beta hydrolase [Verrucomicrobiota bacterium]
MKKLFALILLAVLVASPKVFAEEKFQRTEDVIYGRKFGTALTLDVIHPEKPNGYGILFMVSGGFFSSHEAINPGAYQPYLERGYTIFAIVHGSQPMFTISEIELDIHRAVRFVRHNAEKYGVKSDHLGITGGSAGGHLSLTLGTQGAKGNPAAKDEVDRASSEVQAVACFYPPTDFLNWSKPGDDGVGFGPTIKHQAAFGARSFTPEGRQKLGQEISPLYFVTSNMAPTLVIHGDADDVVPLYQAKIFEKRCAEVGASYKLIVRPGKGHGWDLRDDMQLCADWFDERLRGMKLAK